MKKVIILVCSIFMLSTLSAQVRWGAKLGLNLSTLTAKEGSVSETADMGVGFHLGGVMEYSFSESLMLQPELLFSMNNSKYKQDEGDDNKYTINQIQIPVNLKFKSAGDNLKFFATAGPYIGFGLSAKMKYGDESIDLYEKIEDETPMKRFDMGVGVGAGIEVSKFTVGLGYQLGLANFSGYSGDGSLKAKNITFSVGYFF